MESQRPLRHTEARPWLHLKKHCCLCVKTNNKAGTPVLNAWAALGLRGILPVFMIDSGIAAWVVEVRAENQLRLLLPLQWPCFLVCQCLKGIFYHSCSALLCGVAVLSWGWMCFHRAISWYLALENVTLAVVCIVYPICQSPLSVEMELFLLEQCVCVCASYHSASGTDRA